MRPSLWAPTVRSWEWCVQRGWIRGALRCCGLVGNGRSCSTSVCRVRRNTHAAQLNCTLRSAAFSGRAVQAGQVRAEQLPILAASATADTSLATACQSQATVHAGQHPLRHRATGELSLAPRSAACLRVRGMRTARLRRMQHSLRLGNPPRCTARASPCLGHPCGAPTD